MKRLLKFALAAALGFGWALGASGQSECKTSAFPAGLPIPGTNGTDPFGTNHQNECLDPLTGRIFFPGIQSTNTGLLNGHLVLDGIRFPQTEGGFNTALSLVLPSGTIEIPPNVNIPVLSGIIINKPITVLCSQNQVNDNPPANPGGFSGTGVTMVQMAAGASGGKIDGCNFTDTTGSASTIGLFLGPDVVNWTVENASFTGNLGSLLGTAMKWTHAIKGRVLNSNFQGWNEDIECNNNGIGAKSNANHLLGNQIRTANIGIQLNADCTDDLVYSGGSNENNGTGINAATFTVPSIIQVEGVDFEDIVGAKTSINLGTGPLGLASSFNHFNGGLANKDIVIGAGNTADSVSLADEINEGVTHNGTGALAIYSTMLGSLPSIAGTGCVIDIRTHGVVGMGIVGTNCTGSNYVMSGFSSFDIRAPINDLGGVNNTRIAAATGKAISLQDHTQSDIDRWTETTGIQAFDAKLTTAGLGHPITLGVTSQKAETQAADANVLTVTPAAVVGTYRVCSTISVTSATNGVISWTLSWTDSSGNPQAAIPQPLFQLGTAAPNTTFTTSAAGDYTGCSTIDVNAAAANIVVKWVGGGTTIAKMSATVERIQ